ncbi:MAG: hypothetical protein HKN41_08425 [Ilumatobacter sp.]|nr:hypothetical protein [Ilumatobacter sp.]
MAHRDVIVQINLALTAVFAVTASYAAAVFSTASQWVAAVTALALFAIGVFAFLWSYWNAVQRSRSQEISVTQLYLLLGDAIPSPVRRTMNLTLLMQVVIAVATTAARPDGPDGNPGSSLAVGILVPMLGFGLNGLWAAYHGDFETRANLPPSSDEIRQNADHG